MMPIARMAWPPAEKQGEQRKHDSLQAPSPNCHSPPPSIRASRMLRETNQASTRQRTSTPPAREPRLPQVIHRSEKNALLPFMAAAPNRRAAHPAHAAASLKIQHCQIRIAAEYKHVFRIAVLRRECPIVAAGNDRGIGAATSMSITLL